MSKNLFTWISCFGISCLLQWLGFMQQGKAFMLIGLILIIISIISTIQSHRCHCKPKTFIKNSIVWYLLTIFITWILSKVFGINFYLMYELLTLLTCILNKNRKD